MPAPVNWQKSSFSGGGEGNACLELAASAQALHLRESDDPTIVLTTSAGLKALIHSVKAETVEP